MWGQGAEASRTRTLADIQARTESILVTDSGILPMDNIRIIPEMTIDSRVSSGNESNQLSLLSPEVQLALTLM